MSTDSRCPGCFDFRSADGLCPDCLRLQESFSGADGLPQGEGLTLHDRYIVGSILGCGGFGITYLCFDTHTQQKVAVKEYMPEKYARRTGITVGEKTAQMRPDFEDGLRKFRQEAEVLKRCTHPNIVRVIEAFEANRTAYFSMDYLGKAVLTDLVDSQGPLSYVDAFGYIAPVMNALYYIHTNQGLIHRDVSPENICIPEYPAPIRLIDFGQAKASFNASRGDKHSTPVCRRGYSPPEIEEVRPGEGVEPTIDVYSVAATLYFALTNKEPPWGSLRMISIHNGDGDLLDVAIRDLPEHARAALARALAPRRADRFQTIREFFESVKPRSSDVPSDPPPPPPPPDPETGTHWMPPPPPPPPPPSGWLAWVIVCIVGAVICAGTGIFFWQKDQFASSLLLAFSLVFGAWLYWLFKNRARGAVE
ncbi:MAG TPA: serine/threonine-protein kinase [Bryobacteraceae bacterium]|jgi:serine/threonine protein kinase